MDTLQEINDFVFKITKQFSCKVIPKSSGISENNGFVEIRIFVKGDRPLDCYDCICTILSRYFAGAIIRFPPMVCQEKDFESNEVIYRGSLRIVVSREKNEQLTGLRANLWLVDDPVGGE